MQPHAVLRFLMPGRYARELRAQRLAELRERDGDHCRRCRHPIRFELPEGRDQAAKIDEIVAGAAGGRGAIDNLCLTHARCNANAGDNTVAIRERLRPQREAELFSKARKKRAA